MNELTCTFLIDGVVFCGKSATVQHNLALCEKHGKTMYESSPKMSRSIDQSLDYMTLEDYPGYCYTLLLPNGDVKIGMSHTAPNVVKRFQRLKSDYKEGPIIPLSVSRGGFIAENYYHRKFAHLRVAGVETFTYAPEIAEMVEEKGIAPEVQELLTPQLNIAA